MNKVCFNSNNEIIGFNINNCFDYINIELIDNIEKTVLEKVKEEKLDTFGRRTFVKRHKLLKKHVEISSMKENDFEDENFIYEKQYVFTEKPRKSYLINESYNFTMEDILNEKRKQLKEKFGAKDCILFETFDNEIFDNESNTNLVIGKTFIRLNNESNFSINKLEIPKHSQVLIYCENDNEITISEKENNININEYFKHSAKYLNLSIKSSEKVNIYSFAILIK